MHPRWHDDALVGTADASAIARPRPTAGVQNTDYFHCKTFHGSPVPLITFLVEDNKTIRDALIATLEDLVEAQIAGVAETERDAVQWLAAHTDIWQLAIVDLFLQQGSGVGVLKSLQAHRRPSQHVVVLSNYATPSTRAQCLALGADKVFDKSTELDDFLAHCQSCLVDSATGPAQ